MKKLFFLLLLLPLLGNAQDFEYFGVRAAFTHSNKSHNLGFIGDSEIIDRFKENYDLFPISQINSLNPGKNLLKIFLNLCD